MSIADVTPPRRSRNATCGDRLGRNARRRRHDYIGNNIDLISPNSCGGHRVRVRYGLRTLQSLAAEVAVGDSVAEQGRSELERRLPPRAVSRNGRSSGTGGSTHSIAALVSARGPNPPTGIHPTGIAVEGQLAPEHHTAGLADPVAVLAARCDLRYQVWTAVVLLEVPRTGMQAFALALATASKNPTCSG